MNGKRYPIIRFILYIVSFVLTVGLLRSLFSELTRRDVVEDRQIALEKEEKRNQELHGRLKESTSTAFIEKQAREKLGLAKPGETIVLLGKSQQAGEQAFMNPDGSSGIRIDNRTNWQRWWGLFF